MQQALTKPAGTLAAGPPERVLCRVGDTDAVTDELSAFLDPSPLGLGPSPSGIRALVATSTSGRAEPNAWPRISSDRPAE